MSNQDKDSKVFVGALIGGIVGIGALVLILAKRRDKDSSLNKIGQTIAHIGEIFESHDVKEPSPMKNAEKKIHQHENSIAEVLDWVATGIHLWQKFKD